MKRHRFLSVIGLALISLCLMALLSGCDWQKKVVFKDRSYSDVFDKSVDFISSKNWEVREPNKAKGTMIAVLGEPQGELFKSSGMYLNIKCVKAGEDVEVYLSSTAAGGPFWDADVTLKEYIAFVGGAAVVEGETPSAGPTEKSEQLQGFLKLVEESKMIFTAPPSLVETPVVENPQILYNYAMKDPEGRFEVRYTIAASQDKSFLDTINNQFWGLYLVYMLNASAGKLDPDEATSKVGELPKDAVRAEFNADGGYTSAAPAGEDFGQGYSNCMMVGIKKDNVGAAFIFYLYNELSMEDFNALIAPVYHALKFK